MGQRSIQWKDAWQEVMPTLEEMQRWLRGEDVEGFPEHDKTKALKKASSLNLRKVDAKREGRKERCWSGKKYEIIGDGEDAILKFGRYNGEHLTHMVTTPDGYSYIEWMLNQDFPRELLDIIENLLEGEIKPRGNKW